MFVQIIEREAFFEYRTERGEKGRRGYQPWDQCEALERLFSDLKTTSYEIFWSNGAVSEGCIALVPVL